MNKKQKFALVLSGGGFRGAFQLGTLNHLKENWKAFTGLSTPMHFDIIAGVSVGALNGAFVAMNALDTLNDIWVRQIAKNGVGEIYTSDFIRPDKDGKRVKLHLDLKQLAGRLLPDFTVKLNFLAKLGLIFSKKRRTELFDAVLKEAAEALKTNLPKIRSIADNTPLKEKLQTHLKRTNINGTQFICGFVSLDSGNYHGVNHTDFASEEDFVNAVLASTSIPMVWEPVEPIVFQTPQGLVTSRNNVDGGIRNVSPLGDVIKRIESDPEECAYHIIVINCNSGVPKPVDYSQKSIGAIAARSVYEIALTEIFNNDVEHFLRINDLVKQAKVACPATPLIDPKSNRELKTFELTVISPDPSMDLGDALAANEKLVMQRMEYGKQITQNSIKI